jgi:hypothetical protein
LATLSSRQRQSSPSLTPFSTFTSRRGLGLCGVGAPPGRCPGLSHGALSGPESQPIFIHPAPRPPTRYAAAEAVER